MFTERVQSEQEPRDELNADVWARAQPQVTGKGWQVPGALTVAEWMTLERSPWSIPQLAPYGSSQSHPLYS